MIIGASFAGSFVAKRLDSLAGAHITLIEKQEELFVSTSTPRALVKPWFAEKAFIPLTNLLNPRHQIIHSTVISCDLDKVTLGDGTCVRYDYLVIATGTSYGLPFKLQLESKELTMATLTSYTQLVSDSQEIVVVGGGSVGVEVSSEIKDYFPLKNITLVCSAPHLLPNNNASDYTRSRLLSKLKSKNINVRLSTRIIECPEKGDCIIKGPLMLHTTDGETINADIALFGLGIGAPNIDFCQSLLGRSMNSRNELIVTDTLQVDLKGCQRIFSLGDVAGTNAPKAIPPIYPQADIIAHNIRAMINRTELKRYIVAPEDIIAVTLSSSDAVAQIPYVPSFIADTAVATLKGRVITVSNQRIYSWKRSMLIMDRHPGNSLDFSIYLTC